MINQEITKFSSYGLSYGIREALELLGYTEPTGIQKEVIPAMLEGKNVVAKAPTGSGKTAAFVIPICEKIVWEENEPQALILEPTRELAVQVREEAFHIGRKKRLKVPVIFGGLPIDKQIRTLRQKSHIVVGTPGRVMDHVRRDSLKMHKISYLVIDEADLMLDMGFIDEIKEILSLLPENTMISLFSATLKAEITQLTDAYIKDPVLILQEQKEWENTITQKVYSADAHNKYQTFLEILKKENPKSCIIFCATREMVHTLFQKLRRNRIFCGMLHGEMDQRDRLKTVDAFRRGCFHFLIATDVAARGVDFEHLSHVINYDFPTGKEVYIHRIGRTGRNGQKGIAISLVTEDEVRMLRSVETYISQQLPVLECPKADHQEETLFWQFQRKKAEAKPKKGEAVNRDITRLSIGGGQKSKMRTGDIVGTICSIEGIESSDIGIIDIRDSISYVEILNNKGEIVRNALQDKTIKGKVRKVKAVAKMKDYV